MLRMLLGISLLAITGPLHAQSAPAPAPIVIGESHQLASRVMDGTRVINVYTPPGYAEGSKRYPVLYLLDGGVDQDFHHITGLAQLGTIVGTTQDIIVIGIETRDRRNELAFLPVTDPKLKSDYPTAGGSGRFRRFIAEEVKSWVESRYRTNGDDALMGESLAGLFVVETLLTRPGLFKRYVAISPSMWWDNEALGKRAPAALSAFDRDEKWLWLSVGDEKGMGVDRLAEALKAGAPPSLHWTYAPNPHETHATIYHGAALAALRALYPVRSE